MLLENGIIEWSELERTIEGHLVQFPYNKQGHQQLGQGAQRSIQSR